MNTTFIYIIIMNIIGFCLMGLDKHRARTRQWRIPEKVLFGAALLGGTAGRQRRGLGRDVHLPPQDAPLVFCRGHAADFGCADRASVVLFALNTQLSG